MGRQANGKSTKGVLAGKLRRLMDVVSGKYVGLGCYLTVGASNGRDYGLPGAWHGSVSIVTPSRGADKRKAQLVTLLARHKFPVVRSHVAPDMQGKQITVLVDLGSDRPR